MLDDDVTDTKKRHWNLEIRYRQFAIGSIILMFGAGAVFVALVAAQISANPWVTIASLALTFIGLAATVVTSALSVYHSLKN